MHLSVIDWAVIAAYFLFNFLVGLYYRRRATGSVSEYFVGGGKVGWWLAGTSMVATTFAADTPLAVTGLVAENGIAGNWVWWSMLLSSMLTVFFFARLWRRSGVLTDVEFAEMRYSGKPAAFLRGFRALYLGIPVNLIVLGWVNLAMVKILTIIFPDLTMSWLGITPGHMSGNTDAEKIAAAAKMSALVIVFGMMFITAFISTLAGLWGVMVTDMYQFFLKMTMVIVLAYFAVKACGGLGTMVDKIHALDTAKAASATGGQQGSLLSFTPDLNSAWMPMIVFFVYIGVSWWATWYPGAEPGGGGYVAQRILCAKDEKNSLLATLWFGIAHYAVRPWPWILTALASLVLYPELKDKESGFVKTFVDPNVFPVGLRGVMIAAFAAAYMSTIATQLNWGASYLVNDFYRRFLVKGKTDKHYVRIGQVATLALMVISIIVTYYQTSISGAWKFLMAIGAGTGSVFILRWFWWRINAWSEVAAMCASFIVSMLCELVVLKYWIVLPEKDPRIWAYTILITVACSTAVWLLATFLTAPEDKNVLLAFYRKVQPSATLWGPIAREATDVQPRHDGMNNLLDWFAGCVMIYMTLFGVGKIIFGQVMVGVVFLVIAFAAAFTIYWDLNRRGWAVIGEAPTPAAPEEQRPG